jgi:glycosyltransferase involved in cell wall biosynthesis
VRILLANHQFFPAHHAGTEVATRDVGLELLGRGHEVHVLTGQAKAPGLSTEVQAVDYTYRGLEVHAIRLPVRGSPTETILREYDDSAVADHAREYATALRPDLIHMFHMARLGAATAEALAEIGVPMFFTATDFWAICPRNTLLTVDGKLCAGPDPGAINCLRCRRAERWLEQDGDPADPAYYARIAARAAEKRADEEPNLSTVRAVIGRQGRVREATARFDAILAPTDFMRSTLAANGIDPKLLRTSPYGLDLSEAKRALAERKPSATVRFGYVGMINVKKGIHLLIEAFRRLEPSLNASLRIVGDLTSSPGYARSIFEQAEDDRRIDFTGFVPNERISGQLARIDVLVVPSTWYENAPITILSAMSAGIPVIATDLGGMSEVVEHERNGLLFPPGDVGGLEAALRRMVEEDGLVEELAVNATDARSAADAVDEILRIYEEVRKSGSPIAMEDEVDPPPPPPPIPLTAPPARVEDGERQIVASRPAAAPRARRRPGQPRFLSRRIRRPAAGVASGPGANPTSEADHFFVIGRAKSGTSWLMRMLNSHPEILCLGEGRFFGRDYLLGDVGSRSLYGALMESGAIRAWAERSIWTRRKDIDDEIARFTGYIAHALMDAELADTGKRIVGDKTPLTGAAVVREITRLSPGSRIVHIVRDGRDVAVSSVHHVWNQSLEDGGVHRLDRETRERRDAYRADPEGFIAAGGSIFSPGQVAETAADWAEQTRAALEQGRALPDETYAEVRYEDLLDAAAPELARLCEFLGADSDPAAISRCVEENRFERVTRGRRRGVEDSTVFMRNGVAGDWRRVMNAEDRAIFTEVAGDLLISLGYEADDGWG